MASLLDQLLQRADHKCEICSSNADLKAMPIQPSDGSLEKSALLCATCHTQVENPETIDANHWRALNDSMWSAVPAVQVLSWRMLDRLRAEAWPLDLLDMMYMDEATAAWAKAEKEATGDDPDAIVHLDCNGNVLQAGDTVVLTQTLNVKGANLIAKRGTAVRRISLVDDNAEQIEGKVNGQHIVILTKFVKKQ